MIRQKFLIDIGTRRLHAADRRILGRPVDLYARDELVLCFAVEDIVSASVQTPVDLSGNTFRFGIKKASNLHDPDKLAFSDTDRINIPGDWDDADFAEGNLSVRLDLNTTPIVDLFASSSADVRCVAELEAQDGGKATTIVQFLVDLKPDVIRGTAGTPDPGQPQVVTAPMLDNFLQNPEGTVRIDENGILRIWDRGAEEYIRAEFDHGILVPVDEGT